MFLASLATIALLAGCGGGGDDDAGDDGIASLGTTPAAPEETPTTTAPAADSPDDTATDDSLPVSSDPSDSIGTAEDVPSTDPEQAMLDYAECMRDNGIDMPDPEFSGDGGGMMIAQEAGEAGSDQPTREEFEEAEEECSPLMDAAMSDIERDPEREAEMREQALAYAQCMRENGIDMPDPEFGDNGGMTMSIGDPDSDEEFQAANEACADEGGGMAIGAAPGSAPEGDE